MAKVGKRAKALNATVNRDQAYNFTDAVSMVKNQCQSKV